MKLEEAIKHAKDVATKKYRQAMLHRANAEDEKLDRCIECMKEHEQLADWLEELKELRKYKEKYRWHNVKEHPDDLPNGNYLKGVWFDVILFKIKNSPTRLNMQYCEDLGFCFYQSSKNSRRKFITSGEANLTEVVAWREIEEFESEEEDED